MKMEIIGFCFYTVNGSSGILGVTGISSRQVVQAVRSVPDMLFVLYDTIHGPVIYL
jgi:hypothetical protein